MARVNILKRVKVEDQWKMVSIPRRKKTDNYDWKALPDGRYYIEWYQRGKRRRQAAGQTASDALEAARRKKHQLEGRALGIEGVRRGYAGSGTTAFAAFMPLDEVAAFRKRLPIVFVVAFFGRPSSIGLRL